MFSYHELSEGIYTNMKYISQLDYAHVPYPTRVKEPEFAPNGKPTTVRSSGCGICSACMAIDILTDTTLDIEACVRMSIDSGANHLTGTDMQIFAPVLAERFGLDYSPSNDKNELIAHLQNGGVAIIHVGVPVGKEIGLFSGGGHYMLLISTDGKDICILDPSYTPEKYEHPARKGRVNTENAPFLYCDADTVDSETKPQKIKYHLFKRAKKQ